MISVGLEIDSASARTAHSQATGSLFLEWGQLCGLQDILIRRTLQDAGSTLLIALPTN